MVDLIISQLEAYWNCQSPAFRVVAGYRGLYAGPIRVVLRFALAASQTLSPDHSQATKRSTHRRASQAQPRQDSMQPGAEAPMYTAIPIESIDRIADVQYDEPPRWVLVVEKETTFRERMEELNQQAIVDPANGSKGFGVLVTVSCALRNDRREQADHLLVAFSGNRAKGILIMRHDAFSRSWQRNYRRGGH